MKKMRYIVPVLMALLMVFTGCELYMDEPGAEEPVANGDGFSAPKSYSDSLSTVVYQFNEGTVLLSEQHRPYIFRFRGDSINSAIEIWFSKSIPSKLLPVRTNYLATDILDVFPEGLCHQVDVVEEIDGCYVVKAHAATMKEVFKDFRITSDFYVLGDTTAVDDEEDPSRSGEGQQYKEAKLVPLNGGGNSRDIAVDKPLPLVGVALNVAGFANSDALAEVANDRMKKLANKVPALSSEKFKMIKLSGELDGYLGLEYDIALRVHIELDSKNDYYDVYLALEQDFFAGVLLSKVRGTLTVPISGWAGSKIKTIAGNTVVVKKLEYLINKMPLQGNITTGVGVVTVKLEPKLILELFGEFSSEKPVGVYYHKRYQFPRFGFHIDKDRSWVYPFTAPSDARGVQDAIGSMVDFPSFDNYDLDEENGNTVGLKDAKAELNAGVVVHFIVELAAQWNKVAEIGVSGDFGYEYKLNYELYDKYNNIKVKYPGEDDYESVWSSERSKTAHRLFFVPTFYGKIITPWREYDLFSFSEDEAFSHDLGSTPLMPSFKTKVVRDESKSTSEEAWYTATVYEVDGDYKLKPDEAPRLAIFYDTTNGLWQDYGGYTEMLILPYNATADEDYMKGKTYKYSFKLPVSVTSDEEARSKTYVAMPVFRQFGLSRYSTGVPFKLNGIWGSLSNLEQVRVKNGSMGDSQIYGFKFDVDANYVTSKTKWEARITLSEYNISNGKKTGSVTKNFVLGDFKNNNVGKYLMFFNGKKDKYYHIDIALDCQYGPNYYEIATERLEGMQSGGGTVEVDYSLMNSSAGAQFGYEILE